MQSVFVMEEEGRLISVCSDSFGAGRKYFVEQLQLLTWGEFFKTYSFCACGFVMSVPHCPNKGP